MLASDTNTRDSMNECTVRKHTLYWRGCRMLKEHCPPAALVPQNV